MIFNLLEKSLQRFFVHTIFRRVAQLLDRGLDVGKRRRRRAKLTDADVVPFLLCEYATPCRQRVEAACAVLRHVGAPFLIANGNRAASCRRNE